MANDRTGGIRHGARIKPPVVHFSESFSPKSQPPTPFDPDNLGAKAYERGFSDGESEAAKDVLSRIGFQHASLYFDLFKEPDGSLEDGATIELLHRCVAFDRKLQALLLEYIGLFELQFRAQYSYFMSNARGPFAHRNPGNFKDADKFRSFLQKYGGEFNRQLRKRNAELLSAYDTWGDAPVWLAVEIMSFGTLSMLYKNTKSKMVRKGVAASFGATPEELESWTHSLSDLRNTCAHFGRVCGTRLTAKPRTVPEMKIDNGTPFYAVLVLQYLLSRRIVHVEDPSVSYDMAMMRDFAQLFMDYSDVSARCGIPVNWFDYLFSKTYTGVDAVIIGDFLKRDGNGKVWFTVSTDDGLVNIR